MRQDPHLGGHDGRAEKVGGHRIGVLVPSQDLHQPGVRMTTVCKDFLQCTRWRPVWLIKTGLEPAPPYCSSILITLTYIYVDLEGRRR